MNCSNVLGSVAWRLKASSGWVDTRGGNICKAVGRENVV